MNTENLSTLKIHKLTQEQYDRELAAGNIDENALYLTPDDTTGIFCHSEIITGSLPAATTNQTHTITKTWSGGIPVVRSVSYIDGDTTIEAAAIVYMVVDDDINGELRIRTQRPTGVTNSTAVSYALQVDVIRT